MRRAIVHIGTPRTGTTTLQRVLSTHRGDLERQGILYPELIPAGETVPHLSHQYLGEALAGRRPPHDRADLLADLDRQLGATSCDTVLLSYEGLCLIPASFRTPQLLSALFARHEMAMETVLTVKPQVEYLNSTYTWRMQFLREARLFASFLRGQSGARELDYGRLAAPWRAASAGRMIAVPVRDARRDGPLVERVFAALGLADRTGGVIGGEDLGLVENRSPGPVAVEVCRRLRAGGAALALGRRAREATRFVEQAARDRGCDRAAFLGYDDSARTQVEARWATANERFARSVWGDGWPACVAAAPSRPPNEIAASPASADTEGLVREVLGVTCRRFDIVLAGPVLVRAREAAAIPGAIFGQLRRRLRGLKSA